MQFIMILVGKHAVFSFTNRIKLEDILGLAHVSSQELVATCSFLFITSNSRGCVYHISLLKLREHKTSSIKSPWR